MIKNNIVRSGISVLCAIFLAYCSISLAQGVGEGQPKEKPGKKGGTPGARWEGVVVRTDKDASTITVRKAGSVVEREIHYDSSTKFTAQEHASKKVEDIDPSQIKEEDRVICLGTYSKQGGFQATMISKRLSHSPR